MGDAERHGTGEGSLVPLVIGATYSAQFKGVRQNKDHDPIVRISNPEQGRDYFGYVRKSTSPDLEQRAIANEIRRKLKSQKEEAGIVNVRVIGQYEGAGAGGPYKVICTDWAPHVPSKSH